MDLAIMHKNLWAWLAEEPSRAKCDWPGFMEVDSIRNECPACEYAFKKGIPGKECPFCPLRRSARDTLGTDYDDDACLGGLYTRYGTAVSVYRRLKCTHAHEPDMVETARLEAIRLTETIRDLKWSD